MPRMVLTAAAALILAFTLATGFLDPVDPEPSNDRGIILDPDG
jgi:hypothetical protein